MQIRSNTIALALLLLMTGCSSSSISPSGLPVIGMQIGSKSYHLEIAANDATREHGLMERDAMDADHGMIFVFSQPDVQNFWMRHTRFPLDIIYADDHQKIVSVDTMKPYDELTPHRSAAPVKYAIELSSGEIVANGVKPGDKLQIPPQVDAALQK